MGWDRGQRLADRPRVLARTEAGRFACEENYKHAKEEPWNPGNTWGHGNIHGSRHAISGKLPYAISP